MVASPENFPLLKELLAEQQRLDTPAARFAGVHAAAGPALQPIYRDLIPLSSPKPGEQYAFEVTLDSCTGCKACVSACHSLNGLDDIEAWRDVGLIVGGDERHPFQQTVTTACHHCADPACLNGCPVLAYEKDPVTGIVRHLDDQCIGCQYCVLKCPYDVPKYNARLGIVRKCDMCHSRLAEGEAPACVQACPTHAIRIITVPVKPPSPPPEASVTYYVTLTGGRRAEGRVDTSQFLEAAPDPAYTQPTTRYLSRKRLPVKLAAADANMLRPQPPHWPLVLMLTLLPLAVGAQLASLFTRSIPAGMGPLVTATSFDANLAGVRWNVANYAALIGWGAGALGLAASVAHLGQPLRAWRIFLGWRRSWLSREAMAFGVWFATATMATALQVPAVAGWLQRKTGVSAARMDALGDELLWTSVVLGVLGLACSVMIYVDTRRVFWRLSQTAPRFLGSAWILGSATLMVLQNEAAKGAWLLGAGTLFKLAFEFRAVRPAGEADDETAPTPRINTARILLGPLGKIFGTRVTAALVCNVLLPAMLVAGVVPAPFRWVIFAGVLGGELVERFLFFRAVDAPKMPGLPAGFGEPGKPRS